MSWPSPQTRQHRAGSLKHAVEAPTHCNTEQRTRQQCGDALVAHLCPPPQCYPACCVLPSHLRLAAVERGGVHCAVYESLSCTRRQIQIQLDWSLRAFCAMPDQEQQCLYDNPLTTITTYHNNNSQTPQMHTTARQTTNTQPTWLHACFTAAASRHPTHRRPTHRHHRPPYPD